MKIEICGYSGSGKSTLAEKLGKIYNIPVLHLDKVRFLPNYQEITNEEMAPIVEEFMKQDNWIIDGNYTKVAPSRYDDCDILIYMNFNRLTCLRSVIKRNKMYKNKVRPDMADGCIEKLDWEFLMWILFKGRKKHHRKRVKLYKEKYPNKLMIFKNRKMVNRYIYLLEKTINKGEL